MSNLRRVVYTLLLVAFIAALQLGTSMSRDHYACPICGNRKDVLTTTIFFLPVFQKDQNATGLPVLLGHTHQWIWSGKEKRTGIGLLIEGAP